MKKILALSVILAGCVTEKSDNDAIAAYSKACLAEKPFSDESMNEIMSDPRFYKGPPAMSRCADMIPVVTVQKNLDGAEANVTVFDSTCTAIYSAKNISLGFSGGGNNNVYHFWNGKIANGKTVGTGVYFAEIIYTKQNVTDTLAYTSAMAIEDSCIIK